MKMRWHLSYPTNITLPQNRNLIVSNLSFQYSPNAPLVLKNLNFIIPAGKVTAIVGDSGCGKSTLLKLLLRLYMPSYGEVCMEHEYKYNKSPTMASEMRMCHAGW